MDSSHRPEVSNGTNVKSAERALHLLAILSEAAHPLSLTELQEITGYPRSSLHGILRTLTNLDWLRIVQPGTLYTISHKTFLVGTAYLDNDPSLTYANKTLEYIRQETGHTVHYARRQEDSVIYLVSRESMKSAQQTYRVGRKVPGCLTGLGLALFAELTDDEVVALHPQQDLPTRTEKSIKTRDDLLKALAEVRKDGWAAEYGHGMDGIGCIAMTVDYRIPATDAISCSAPLEILEQDCHRQHIIDVLTEATRDLAFQLKTAGIR